MLRPTNGKHSAVIRVEKINSPGGVCTAFVVSDEWAITAGHCTTAPKADETLVGNAVPDKSKDVLWKEDSFRVYNSQGENLFLIVKPIVVKRFPDFAVLLGDFKAFNKLKIKVDTVDTRVGQTIYTCGFPGGLSPAICNTGELTGTTYFSGLTNSYIAMGMSGGPVFDKDYKAIGLNVERLHAGHSAFAFLQGLIRIRDE